MLDLSDQIPRPDEATTALETVGLAAISTVPLVGPLAAAAGQTAIANRAARRRAEFDGVVVAALEGLARDKTDLTAADVLDSDEFLAAYAKAARAADESASVEKRARLARALTHMGPWDRLEANRRQMIFDLVVRYDDLHILLLDFFRDPREWVRRGEPGWEPGYGGISSIRNLLGTRMFPGIPDWPSTVEPALGVLGTDHTAEVPLKTMMSVDGTAAKRTTELGDDVLRMVADPSEIPSSHA